MIDKNIKSFLENFKDHRRLGVFYHKGLKCVCCDLVGNRIVFWYGYDRINEMKKRIETGQSQLPHSSGLHIDLIHEKNSKRTLLTVDHFYVPKCRGGKRDLWNLVPMCSPCNKKKRSSFALPPPVIPTSGPHDSGPGNEDQK